VERIGLAEVIDKTRAFLEGYRRLGQPTLPKLP
jgi:hypothetical protein